MLLSGVLFTGTIVLLLGGGGGGGREEETSWIDISLIGHHKEIQEWANIHQIYSKDILTQ